MILSFINIRKVPREVLKTSGFALGFQHFPRDLANVNEWKIMFDPSISNFKIQFIFSNVVNMPFCLFCHDCLYYSLIMISWTPQKKKKTTKVIPHFRPCNTQTSLYRRWIVV